MRTVCFRPWAGPGPARFLFRLTVAALALAGLALIASPDLSAHGVSWDLSAKKAYGLEFSFDDGSPMSFAEIKVFRPGGAEAPSQIGRADKNGYFAFIPDAEGQWTVKADDGAGHLAQALVEVAASGAEEAAAEGAAPGPGHSGRALAEATKPFKVALVISLFLNLAAAAVLWRRRKP